MELYMMNRQHGRMILEFVENGPIIWPSIEENRVARPKKYSELSATKAIQAYCDVKETNIILQGLPTEVYALVSNQKITKELWERIQLLMQGTSLTKQEREFNQQQQQPEFPLLDLGLTVLVFKQGDDPIDVINHMMSFLSAVVTSRYPTTNNQLRNSSNPRQQTTINDGRITLKPVHGRKNSFDLGTSRTCTLRASGSNFGKQMTDSNCDEINTAKVALMANLSHYGSDALAKVHNPDNVDTNMINPAVQAMPSSKQSNVLNHSKTKITSDSNIIPYSQYVIEKTSAIVILGSEETRMLAEESCSKMLLKQKDPMMLEKKVDTTPNSVNSSDPTPSNRPTKVEVLKGLPKVSMMATLDHIVVVLTLDQAWANSKTFKVGDNLVADDAFANCIIPPGKIAHTSGHDIIELSSPGKEYFICGVSNHCATFNQKLAVDIKA
uniref:Phytocyanin domain-containing protein n=1 Tax=Tanacetum cinerariifolium TaxID=118510 RepID=A0A6L2LFG5_TANCI|nr:hypothetical protein [Tanacetum cinerariifolium]